MKQEKKSEACKCEKCGEKCKCGENCECGKCCKCSIWVKIAVVVVTILVLVGIGFGIYGLFFKDKAAPSDESAKEETVAYDLTSVSGAQEFLDEILGLPNNIKIYGIASNDTLTEKDKAVLIQGVATSLDIDNVECESGAVITLETYSALYEKLFGQKFEYKAGEDYSGVNLGRFSDKPCVCCEPGETENGYYIWRTSLADETDVNLVAEKVDKNTIYGKVYTLSHGLFDESEEPKLSGEFELKFAKNDNGYYITAFKRI